MTREENFQQEIIKKFSFLSDKVKVARPRRISLEVPYEKFLDVFRFVIKDQKFVMLCTITGLDEGDNLGFIYHLSQEGGITLNFKSSVPKSNPVIKSVIDIFPGAEMYEREMADLFGFKVEGLPSGNRYPLTDDWPKGEFPLRKDWKATSSEQVG